MHSLRVRVPLASVLGTLLTISLCWATACKQVTETVVEKGVKVAKDAAKGVEEGIDKGRKQGQSVDDAIIVSRLEDLKGNGRISFYALRPAKVRSPGTDVEIAVENTASRPLRISNLELFALDKEGFVRRPTSTISDITVPPKTKDKLVVTFDGAPSSLKKLRIWGQDHDAPEAKEGG